MTDRKHNRAQTLSTNFADSQMALNQNKDQAPEFASNGGISSTTGRKTSYIKKTSNVFQSSEVLDVSPKLASDEIYDDYQENQRRMPFQPEKPGEGYTSLMSDALKPD